MTKPVIVFVMTCLSLAVCQSVFAITVSHSVDGVLIDDGFEANSPGDDPAGWIIRDLTVTDIQVVTAGFGDPPAPTAAEGANSLAVHSTFALPGIYSEPFATPYTSGVIMAEFAFYLSDIEGSTLYVTFRHDAEALYFGSEHWVGFGNANYMNTYGGTSLSADQGGVLYYPGSGSDIALTVGGSAFSYNVNTWNNATLTYDIAAKTLGIAVNGTVLDPLPAPSEIAQGLVTGIAATANSGGLAYLDSIGSSPPAQPGDFDGDGDVDGADFVVWQTNFPKATGGTLATGDADGDGDVDGADFVVWQTNFPFTPSPSAAPVPEPTGIALAFLSSFGAGVLLRGKHHCSVRPTGRSSSAPSKSQ